MQNNNKSYSVILSDNVSTTDQCTLQAVCKIIQEWLRRAGDRIIYINKKQVV